MIQIRPNTDVVVNVESLLLTQIALTRFKSISKLFTCPVIHHEIKKNYYTLINTEYFKFLIILNKKKQFLTSRFNFSY